MLLALLAIIATALTVGMFSNRQAMMGFACGIFWALTGAQAYTLSTATWDVYFLFAFGSLLGMLVLVIFGAFALRTKKDEAKEGDLFFDEGGDDDMKFIDEGGKGESNADGDKPRRSSRNIRDRAEKRRSRWD